ncbi:MAG: tetratricopeptide repeat protein [Planctomycetota bacterium]|nr:tetratricopeptide repeat protein [Planctomycetota bacterium]
MRSSAQISLSRNRSWRKKLAFAFVATVGFFLLFEFGLRLGGVQPVTDRNDPFAGFSQLPMLEAVEGDGGEQLLTTARGKLVWFNAQTFPRQKPAGTRRVFCVGGSTTYGRPYWDMTSYCGWLRELLPLADSSCDWEVINAGGISYASYRVAAVMEELARYEPDLFIVYSAHNEFLERRTYAGMFEQSPVKLRVSAALSQTRTWALLDRVLGRQEHVEPTTASSMFSEEVDEILNHTVGPSDYHRDNQWREDVLQHYELNLQRMAAIAKRAGAKIVFLAPAANEKDCAPFKSEAISGLSDTQVKQFRSHLAGAQEHMAAGQLDDAMLSLEQAQVIDDGYAAVHYQMGKALFALGRTEQAHQAFERALDQDVCPLRALPEITASIRRVAHREHVPVVDFGAQMKAKCEKEFGHPCLGAEYFLDHVHPTMDVHRQLALWIIEVLQRERIVADSALSSEAVNAVAQRIDSRIDKTAQGVALRNLAKVLHWAGKFDEAAPRAADALRLIENDLESQFLLAECWRQMGRSDEALLQFERLFEIEPNYERGYIPFGMLLADRGHLAAAKMYLSMGIYLHPDRDDAHHALGAAHLRAGEYELAKQSLLEASTLNPNEPSTLTLLARAQAELGESAAAISTYEQSLRLAPDDAFAHNELGEALLLEGQVNEAIRHFEAALKIDPDHEDARFNLEAARERR